MLVNRLPEIPELEEDPAATSLPSDCKTMGLRPVTIRPPDEGLGFRYRSFSLPVVDICAILIEQDQTGQRTVSELSRNWGRSTQELDFPRELLQAKEVIPVGIHVRLDEELEQLLNQTTRALKKTKSEIIKSSLWEYCSKVLREHQPSSYALIEDLLGKEGSGKGDLSSRGREYILEMLHAQSICHEISLTI